jgi:hypothetical protein
MTRPQAMRLARQWMELELRMRSFPSHAEAARVALVATLVLEKPYYVANQSARKWVVRPNVWEE